MSTDTFETPRFYREDIDDTPPTLREPIDAPQGASGPTVSERLIRLRAVAGQNLDRALAASRVAWGRLRARLRESAARLPRPAVARPSVSRPTLATPSLSLDAGIVIVWSLAVALVAIEVALVVSPLLGIGIALLEGVALGASGRRLYRLVSRA